MVHILIHLIHQLEHNHVYNGAHFDTFDTST